MRNGLKSGKTLTLCRIDNGAQGLAEFQPGSSLSDCLFGCDYGQSAVRKTGNEQSYPSSVRYKFGRSQGAIGAVDDSERIVEIQNLTQRLPANPMAVAEFTLALTAEERGRSRHYFHTDEQDFYLHLPRGTVLQHGDLLQAEANGRLVRVSAKPEPIMTVTAPTSLDLLRAAYHLGNRHVPLEVTPTHLRFSPDPVLKSMLEQLGLEVVEDTAPFQPETGAYSHSHASNPRPSAPAQTHRHAH